MDIASSSASSSVPPKRKRDQVVTAQGLKIEVTNSTMGGVISGETNADCKAETHGVPPDGSSNSSSNQTFENDAHAVKNSVPEFMDYGDENDDTAYEEEEEEEEEGDDDEYADDYEYDIELVDADCNYNLASKFDDMDLPPGVEATVPWLVPPAEKSPRDSKQKAVVEDEVDIKFKAFKKFDTVQDVSDHHYAKKGSKAVKPTSKEWAKRIQHEWKLLENDLPETIFVRAYEDRMDLLRAVIVGPAGTPYHDGLFFFDAQFPPTYPSAPPVVYYHSGGLRLNPNLYDNGYVCLSLLGTWHGKGCETWSSSKSTMLQVLVSIQALVLNEKPYFNEPGYESTSNTQQGKMLSSKYNESTFVLSVRTMLYSLRRPPKHFEDFIAGHFRARGRTILAACKAYMEGTQIGGDYKDEDEDDEADAAAIAAGGESDKSLATKFKQSLEKLFEDLLMEFTVKGADCGKFLAQKVKAGLAAKKAEISA